MLSNELLVDAIKSGATNEEIYELVRSIYGEAMKKTYYSLLKRDKYYQSLLAQTDEAEKKGHDFNNNPELFQVLLNEYEEIRINLEKELTETGKSELYTDLTKLIIKIADYIFRKEEDIRKGIGDIMGGKVLELESERLKAEGRTEGEAIGQVQGETRLGSLITRLLQDQRTEEIPIISTDAKRREQLYKEYNL